jgi:hypothetical protein
MFGTFLIHPILTPAYDKQENIYNDLIWVECVDVTTNAGSNPGAADVIYKGSSTKCGCLWKLS